jgi:hypothetical protein
LGAEIVYDFCGYKIAREWTTGRQVPSQELVGLDRIGPIESVIPRKRTLSPSCCAVEVARKGSPQIIFGERKRRLTGPSRGDFPGARRTFGLALVQETTLAGDREHLDASAARA